MTASDFIAEYVIREETPLAIGIPGHGILTVGPGAVNTLVGLATAMTDTIPSVAITGNCQTYFLERGAIRDISYHARAMPT